MRESTQRAVTFLALIGALTLAVLIPVLVFLLLPFATFRLGMTVGQKRARKDLTPEQVERVEELIELMRANLTVERMANAVLRAQAEDLTAALQGTTPPEERGQAH
jgi:hypothetical protein